MKKAVLLTGAALLWCIAAAALPMQVSWADGKVERQQGSSWVLVGIGDQVDSSDTIRLSAGSSVEISDGKRKVAMTAAGVYKIDVLLAQGAEIARKKNATLDKLGKLVDPKASTAASTVAAVRGAAASDSGVTWMDDEVNVDEVMAEGRALVRLGEFAAAAVKFDEAVLAAEGERKAEAAYAEAWALAADDRPGQAVKLLRGITAAGKWEGPRILLLAQLDLQTGAKAEAETILTSGMNAKLFSGDDLELAKTLLAEAKLK
jgi:hypothetical protein